MVDKRLSTSIGFAIWAFMPAAKAFCLSSSNAFAVMAMIGDDAGIDNRAKIVHHIRQMDFFFLNLDTAALNPAHIEHIVDEA